MIETRLFGEPYPGAPIVIAVFSYRYEAHLVPDFIANIRPFITGYVAWDDRAATTELTSEPERRNRLLAEARKMGARWILAADPDERIEDSLAERLPGLLAQGEGNLWTFTNREMFTPDSYRIDGLWRGKRRLTLFPAAAIGKDLDKALHGEWIASRDGFQLRDAETNYYHFRMATPARRRLRRDLYATADPTRKYQAVGYDYLDDDRGMVLEKIPQGREFSPPFHEDNGLWSPDPGKLGVPVADPTEVRFRFVGRSILAAGHGHASHALQDLAAANPEDPDLLPMAAMLALTADDMPRTRTLASAVLETTPDSILALHLRSKAAAAMGDQTEALADLARLDELVPESLFARELHRMAGRAAADFKRPDADWRRWVPGAATCHEGSKISAAPISVVVIGYRSQKELVAAVASLRAQDPSCEIVVVNSGGGDVQRLLAEHLDYIRLITTDQHLFVGAARNIGIDASRADIVGFLAGDCQALPGWVSGRLREHGQGARSVSNPVVPEPGTGLLGVAAVQLRYSARSPNAKPANRSHYGRSYTRETLALVGCFPPGMQVSEDTVINLRLDLLSTCVWAQDVLTTNRDPTNVWGLLRENFARGKRMADNPPFRDKAGKARRTRDFWGMFSRRLEAGHKDLSEDQSLGSGLKMRLFLTQILIACAMILGVSRALSRRAKADRAEQKARAAFTESRGGSANGSALRDIQRAVALDPHDWRKAMLLGDLLVRDGRDGAEAFRNALALDPTQSEPLTRLLAPFMARGDWLSALGISETAARNSPQTWEHWQKAAEMAANAGLIQLATAYMQRALSLAPDWPAAHAKVEELNRKIGNVTAAMARHATAERLQADRDRRKAK
ncbi:Glycosyltransferase 2-like [Paracoccaceae bacterium]